MELPTCDWFHPDGSHMSNSYRPRVNINLITSVGTIPNFAMRYVSRYLVPDAILVYRVSQLMLRFVICL